MELRILKYFVTIAKEENITRAANSLHVTQPTLSRQIKKLEEELGVSLFKRSNHNIHLTEEGQLFKKRAEELLAMSQKMQDEFKVIDKQVEGNIYLGCGETKGMQFIAQIFKNIQTTYPNINLHIYSGNADDIANRLDKGLLDFGILIQPANLTKYKALTLPSYDKWGAVAKRNSQLAKNKTVTKDDLIDLPLLCSRQAIDPTIINNEFTGWFGDMFDQLNIVSTFNLAYNAGLMVKENVGYALTLDSIINTSEESDLCFIPFEPELIAKHNIVWRKGHSFSKAAQVFLDKAKELETTF